MGSPQLELRQSTHCTHISVEWELLGPSPSPVTEMPGLRKPESPVREFDKSELKERLTPTQYMVTQEQHTEKQFSNKYYKHREKGVYTCIVCTRELFSSSAKYDSGSGWPSFFDVLDKKNIRCKKDASGGDTIHTYNSPSPSLSSSSSSSSSSPSPCSSWR